MKKQPKTRMTKKRQYEINEYMRQVRNLKQRIRKYEKQGLDTKDIKILSKKEVSSLKINDIRDKSYDLSKAFKRFNKTKYVSGYTWEETYRGDQQLLANFYKGISAIENNSQQDSDELLELRKISNWMAKKSIQTQLKILYDLQQVQNQNLWSDIYGSDDPDIDLEEAWTGDLTDIASRYGYENNLRIPTDKLNTKWLEKYKTNEQIKDENPELFKTKMSASGHKYEVPKHTRLEGKIASWDESRSIFKRGF